MKFYFKVFLILVALISNSGLVKADVKNDRVNINTVPRVVVSIKPMHAWVSAVMGDLGAPYLLLKNSDSVHSYSLKPSDAQQLAKADIVFITDKHMETYLQTPLNNLALKAKIIELTKAEDVHLLPAREGGLFEGHKHTKKSYNFHFWLDPQNAIAATKTIAKNLSEIDKDHALIYEANANAYIKRLKDLIATTKSKLKNHKQINFIVFHDAYYYYEKRFGVEAMGSVTIDPAHQPGAKRIEAIRNKIQKVKAACIFTEPQFSPAIVSNIIEGTSAKKGILDPIGANIKPGADSYFKLVDQITNSLLLCSQD